MQNVTSHNSTATGRKKHLDPRWLSAQLESGRTYSSIADECGTTANNVRKSAYVLGVNLSPEMKCADCGNKYVPKGMRRNGKDGNFRCPECQKKRTGASGPEIRRRWYLRNVETARKRQLLRRYGLTLEEYRTMEKEQDGKCAICGEKDTSGIDLAVDHDHASGKVRGLLCRRCNTGIGLFEENVEIFRKIISYIEKFPYVPSDNIQEPSPNISGNILKTAPAMKSEAL